jgi:hypothetical protein
MSNYWGKAPSSRPVLTTALTSASNPIKAGSETYHIRVAFTTVGALSVTDSSATQLSSTVSVPFAANTAGETFTITPGQWVFLYGSGAVTELT